MCRVASIVLLLAGLCCTKQMPPEPAGNLDTCARAYLQLVFQVGKYDGDYVDAYFGPDDIKKQAEAETVSLGQIKQKAQRLLQQLQQTPAIDELSGLRRKNLLKMLESLQARVDFLDGKKMRFDEESKAIYDTVSPSYPDEHYQKILAQLENLVPGTGALPDRFNEYRKQFIVPADNLDKVFKAAIEECRSRTKKFIRLPDNENFVVEYVKGQPWGAYNWFKGNGFSLIQVNSELPISIERIVDLAAHEGYPGHHVYHTLSEKIFYQERRWIEFSVYPLFSPHAVLAEGTANFGISVVFPGEERTRFEQQVLFPLAGLNPELAPRYYQILALLEKLGYAGNEATRRYLDGRCDKQQTIDWLMRYELRSRERAERYVRFMEKYRAYVITYNVGEDMVRAHVEKAGGTPDHPEKRWQEFNKLLSRPVLPSDL